MFLFRQLLVGVYVMDVGFDLVKFGDLVQIFGCDFGIVVIEDFDQFVLCLGLVMGDGD